MNMANGKIGNREKAIIHITKAQIGMTEAEYRAALAAVGAGSAKDLTFRQFQQLIKSFRAEGYQPTGRKSDFIRFQTAAWERAPMLDKIAAQLKSMNLCWNYADGIARRMFKVDAVSWCSPDQLHKVVAALEYKRKKTCREYPGRIQK